MKNITYHSVKLACIAALFALSGMHALLALRFRISSYFHNPTDGYTWVGFGLLACLLFFLASIWRAIRRHLSVPDSDETGIVWCWVTVLIILVAGSCMRLRLLSRYPVDSVYGDMLPLIVSAGEMLLEGQYPYVTHAVPWDLPLTFMPGLWLPYVPFVWARIDPRWLGIISIWGSSLCLYSMIYRGSWLARFTVLAIITPFILSPAWLDFTIQGHTQILWFYTTLYCFFVLKRNYRCAALVLGVLIVSRQTFVLLAPPAIIWALINCSRKDLILCTFCFLVPIAIMLIPFACFDVDAVLFEPLRHYRDLASYEMARTDVSHLAQTPGLANALYRAGAGSWLSWLPWAIMIIFWSGAGLYARNPVGLLAGSGAGLFAMNLVTPIPWYYIFAPPIILMGCSLISLVAGSKANE